MKKVLTATLMIFSLVAATHSVRAQKGFSVSVKGTPQFSWMNNSDDNDNKETKASLAQISDLVHNTISPITSGLG